MSAPPTPEPLAARPVSVAARAGLGAVLALLAVGIWLWWSTAVSTSAARLAALSTVEAYAWAVHEQLMFNFAATGEFFQVIHKGYDDAWTWSGHRAVTLVLNAWLYGLDPDPWWLGRLQLIWVLLGVVPAALLGRRTARADWGLLVGGMTYLGAPAVMALALQDYQDLVFALPCLVFAGWAFGARHPAWAAVGAVVAILPREECVPLAVALALLTVPDGDRRAAARRWAWNVGITVLIAGGYAAWAEQTFPIATSGHDMPLENAVKGLTQGGVLFLDGWPQLSSFYALVFVPFGLFALGAPLRLLPAVGLVALHLTVPAGHGVDRSWVGHCHHMAPAVAFVVLASTVGLSRALRLALHPRLRRAGPALAVLAGGALTLFAAAQFQTWATQQNLRLSWVPQSPAWTHPAWGLVAQLPADAVPAVPKSLSIAASNRLRSYTYDGSLAFKARTEGLGVATHMLVDTRQTGALAWAMAMPGATLVDADGPFSLVTWDAGAADPSWARVQQQRIPRGPQYTGSYRRREDIPGVPPHVAGGRRPEPGTVPVLRMPWAPAPPERYAPDEGRSR